jgi:hypothetical protein
VGAKAKRRTGGIQGAPGGLERPAGGAGPVGGASVDWALIEQIISKAVKASRSEELKELAITVKELAEVVKAGFESHERALSELREVLKEGFEGHERALSELREALKKQGEHVSALSENVENLSKRVASLTDQVAALSERVEALSGEVGKLTADVAKLTATVEKLTADVAKLNVAIGSVGRRFGLDLERTVLNLYKDVLAALGLKEEKVEKLILEDRDGRFYKKGARLELDVYMHNQKVYFIEVKSLVELDDVEWFDEKCRIIERALGVKPERRVLVCLNATKEAVARCGELGIDIVCGRVLEE